MIFFVGMINCAKEKLFNQVKEFSTRFHSDIIQAKQIDN